VVYNHVLGFLRPIFDWLRLTSSPDYPGSLCIHTCIGRGSLAAAIWKASGLLARLFVNFLPQ